MSLSEVPRIELSDDGSTATLYVKVGGFDAGTPVEISGYATQDNGVIATFYKIVNIPDNGGPTVTFEVAGVPVVTPGGSDGFVAEDPIMVVVRAADVWITKLIKNDFIPDGVKAAWESDEQTYHSVFGAGSHGEEWAGQQAPPAQAPPPGQASPPA